jgi:hypothetical protein
MGKANKFSGLQIFDDMRFQEKEWSIERTGRWAMLLIILAALLGLFGWGPVSKASNRAEGIPVWVEYERFIRLKAPVILKVHLDEVLVEGGETSFWLDNEYLKNFRIHYIYPEPDSVESGLGRVTYNFKIEQGRQPDEVLFHLEPETFGWLQGQIGVEDSEANSFSQLIYP